MNFGYFEFVSYFVLGISNLYSVRLRRFVVEESFELAGPDGMLQFPYCFCLNLSDPLTGDLEDSAHLFERVGVAVPDSVSQLDDFAFAI